MAITLAGSGLIVSSGSNDVKGVYTTVVASTPHDSSRIFMSFGNTNHNARNLQVDIAIGAAGAEVIVIANLATQIDTDWLIGTIPPIDIDIPAGTRISARCASSAGAGTQFTLFMWMENRTLATLVNPVTYGATANSRGTQLDPGTTVSTKGTYQQWIASTATRIDALLICVTTAQSGLAQGSFTYWQIDVAIGAAAAETIILQDLFFDVNGGTSVVRSSLQRYPIAIPAGSRIALRALTNRIDSPQRLCCVTLIGMQEPTAATGSSAVPSAIAYIG